jgi:hypothetical protein
MPREERCVEAVFFSRAIDSHFFHCRSAKIIDQSVDEAAGSAVPGPEDVAESGEDAEHGEEGWEVEGRLRNEESAHMDGGEMMRSNLRWRVLGQKYIGEMHNVAFKSSVGSPLKVTFGDEMY